MAGESTRRAESLEWECEDCLLVTRGVWSLLFTPSTLLPLCPLICVARVRILLQVFVVWAKLTFGAIIFLSFPSPSAFQENTPVSGPNCQLIIAHIAADTIRSMGLGSGGMPRVMPNFMQGGGMRQGYTERQGG